MASMNFSDPILHDGTCCPCRVGELVRHHHNNGMVCEEVIAEKDFVPCSFVGQSFDIGYVRYSTWHWAVNDRPAFGEGWDIIKYQILGVSEEEHYTQCVAEDA